MISTVTNFPILQIRISGLSYDLVYNASWCSSCTLGPVDSEVFDVPSQRVLFKLSEGQPRMFRKVIRLLAGAIMASTQPRAGMGYFVLEDVREGQPITMYAQNEIPEWVADILKKKVLSR